MSLHVVSNGKLSLHEFSKIASIIEPWVNHFHIREKHLSARNLYEGLESLLSAGVPSYKIIINDRVDVAIASNTSGVHLAYHSLPLQAVKNSFSQITAGCSTHSLEEALAAEKAGADYLFFGHIYSTSSKQGLQPRGCETLRHICQHINIPVIAIGGITPTNVIEVMRNGASGVAVMSGILDSHDPLHAVKQYDSALNEWKGGHHEA